MLTGRPVRECWNALCCGWRLKSLRTVVTTMKLLDILLGRPLANEEEQKTKIGALGGVPLLGLDGLGSSAYGPEAALTILLPLGAAGLVYIGPVVLVILV